MIVLIMCMAFLGSFLLTRAIRKYALALQLIDIPNDRSSHKRPTPRGGGLAFVLIFFSIVVFLYQASLISTPFALASSAAGLFVAFLGFIDDKRHLSPKIRFSGHFLASGFVLYCFGCFPSIQIANWIVPSGWIMNGLGLFYLTWMLNLFNFMDGIDGLAASETVFSCLAAASLYWILGYSSEMLLPIGLAATVSGFLIWNFPPARIFMGDVGSGFLGIMIGLFSIHAAFLSPSLFWSWLILLGVFIVDSTTTLLRRALNGQRIWEAHCTHAYQHASRHYEGHRPVTLGVLVINIIWLFPWAFFAGLDWVNGFICCLIAYLPLVFLAFLFNAGKPSRLNAARAIN
ncbi:alpha-N-acetylglucosaminyltransferase [Legionella birminghamensis]|uniref:Alpha-N-acetylglucosaminyltransferase n=1 Tax=Legionella birminghamensis TaxID=28083 RepID=A0A378I7U0_9GAMM|nr:glycosyltransferase family 4 protein [Legionella birminghamensis]KTC67993.1 alpha-N-acetylglucosaminyltransferase [Legionella birminghamensis]STX31298.1 UDP-N-acetylmuramyl pentapeptide phosphotransferase/UDP-N- acetylglucosamine-1-phosphate transferase [Legionella birminghamensis]